jgi:cytochrome b6-f complex iron-sulfur subunit
MATLAKPNNATIPTPSRREFLFYLLGASAGLTVAGTCGVVTWFAQQTTPYSPESGAVFIDVDTIPVNEYSPIRNLEGRFYLVKQREGILALDSLCTHRWHSLVRWSPVNWRYECPSCGSKFEIDGTYIEGPAPRFLDRLVIEVRTTDGTVRRSENGLPVSIENAASIVVFRNVKVLGIPVDRSRFSRATS